MRIRQSLSNIFFSYEMKRKERIKIFLFLKWSWMHLILEIREKGGKVDVKNVIQDFFVVGQNSRSINYV